MQCIWSSASGTHFGCICYKMGDPFANRSIFWLLQIFHFLPMLLLKKLCITDGRFCDRLKPHQAWPKVLTARLWHVGVAAMRRQQRVQVVLEGNCSLWSNSMLATTSDDCRASQKLDTTLYISLKALHRTMAICMTSWSQMYYTSTISAAPLGGCCVQRCAVHGHRRPNTQCVVQSCCLTCQVLLPDACCFYLDVQLLIRVLHSPGPVSTLMAVQRNMKAAPNCHSNT